MPPSRIVLAIGFLAASAAGGIVFMGTDVSAGITTPSFEDDPAASTTLPVPAPIVTLMPSGAADEPGDTTPSSVPAPAPLPTEAGVGTISGRIAVSTSLLKKLKAYKIVIQENVNTAARKPDAPRPFLQYRTFKPDWSKGTPFFDMSDIPFSTYAYKVSVVAEGMNGSSAYISLTSHHPTGRGGDVQLSLTPGTVFSVLLRDQRRMPRTGMEVHMVPSGDSLGKRWRHDGVTNNFGNIVFENVERGEYTLTVGKLHAPSAAPEQVTIYAATAIANGRPRVQSRTITVPDGKHVTIEVWSRSGMPLDGAKLRAWQLEIKRFYDFKGETDIAGRHVFENVPFGKYQISVDHPLHGRRDCNFEVKKADLGPTMVPVRMPR